MSRRLLLLQWISAPSVVTGFEKTDEFARENLKQSVYSKDLKSQKNPYKKL